MVLTEERVKELLLRAKQRAGGSEADASAVPAAGVGKFTVIGLLILALIVTGAANGVLMKTMFDSFGTRYAFFANQGNNFNYIAMSLGAVVQRKTCSNALEASGNFPQRKFMLMGLMDGMGTFLSSVAAASVPGSDQTLLNQTLIPVTIVAAMIFLRARYSKGEILGAMIILGGAALTIVPSVLDASQGSLKWYAALVYFSSNIPMAFSAVYKEWAFKNETVNVFYLTFYVSVYQFLISFLFMPVLGLPGFGGIAFDEIPKSLWEGLRCYAGYNTFATDNCTDLRPLLWLSSYSFVNFFYNVIGLFLTKVGSAVLSSVAYAIRLPVTNIIFAICPIMGSQCEPFNGFSVAGLVVVVLGFALYSYSMRQSQARQELLEVLSEVSAGDVGSLDDHDAAAFPRKSKQNSFQERVIGMGMATRGKIIAPDAMTVGEVVGLLSQSAP